MREKHGTNCFSRWRGINAFIRHPKTGRGVTLRRAREVSDMDYSKGAGFDPSRPVELGIFLKKARTARRLTARNVARKTHLKMDYIEAIEAGNFDLLPGGLFNRTFVRMYAKVVGISETALEPFYNSGSGVVSVTIEVQPANLSSQVADEGHVKPPKIAEYLLYLFLTKSERVNLIGDTEEEFNEVLEKFGRRKANAWFYKQVFDSLRPLIFRWLKRVGIVVSVAKHGTWALDFLQRKIK